jgi:hypothetical protein
MALLKNVKRFTFLTLGTCVRLKNASFETRISVIKVFFNTEEDLTLNKRKCRKSIFFFKKSNDN